MRAPIFLLILSFAAGGASAAERDWSQAQTVEIVTGEYRFEPSRIELRRGIPYRIRLKNSGREMHEFGAAALFRASELGNPDVLNVDGAEVILHPGETRELLLVPKQAGRFELACPDHDWAGMTGEIIVR